MQHKRWIQSFSGRMVTPLELKEEQVSISDIAHALANKTRFCGQTSFYSVAQHCVIGSYHCKDPLAFLLHELSEVYLPDIPTPIKSHIFVALTEELITSWAELEKTHTEVCLSALGFGVDMVMRCSGAAVKKTDLEMLETERTVLHTYVTEPWGINANPIPKAVADIDEYWSPDYAEQRFLDRYDELTGKLK